MPSRQLLLAASLVVAFLSPSAQAGKYNPTLDIGDPAPEFQDLAGVDGKEYSSQDFAEADVLVLVFTSNTCPYAVDYEERIKTLAAKYRDDPKVQLVVINPNAVRDDTLEAMKARAKEKELTYLYLKDESGEVAERFGALRTPECFVIDRERKITYMGAFDDNTDAEQVEQRYVPLAIDAALGNKAPAVQETPPVGCLIRQRRRR